MLKVQSVGWLECESLFYSNSLYKKLLHQSLFYRNKALENTLLRY